LFFSTGKSLAVPLAVALSKFADGEADASGDVEVCGITLSGAVVAGADGEVFAGDGVVVCPASVKENKNKSTSAERFFFISNLKTL